MIEKFKGIYAATVVPLKKKQISRSKCALKAC